MSKDLEFISVENDDDEEFGMNQTYGDNTAESSYENALGNTFLKQSKVKDQQLYFSALYPHTDILAPWGVIFSCHF
jgi:hypothetical protein